MTDEQIRETFRYHKPTPEKADRHEHVRTVIIEATIQVARAVPESRERSLFITKMQEAQMWANTAIAIHVPGED